MENEENVREQLADYIHEIWSRWMKHVFDNAISYKSGALIIPGEDVERWTLQMNTPYEKLPEEMKSSDRAKADIILGIIRRNL